MKRKNNIADLLLPLTEMNERKVVQTDTENFVKLKSLHSVPKMMSIKQSESESANDQVLKIFKQENGQRVNTNCILL